MITSSELRKGIIIELGGELHQVIDYHHIKIVIFKFVIKYSSSSGSEFYYQYILYMFKAFHY